MTISNENRGFISSMIDYYVSTASSYKELARVYAGFADSVEDVAFGMIVGSIYYSFMQTCQSQQAAAGLEEINEFNEIIKERAPEIRDAVSESGSEPLAESPGGPRQDGQAVL